MKAQQYLQIWVVEGKRKNYFCSLFSFKKNGNFFSQKSFFVKNKSFRRKNLLKWKRIQFWILKWFVTFPSIQSDFFFCKTSARMKKLHKEKNCFILSTVVRTQNSDWTQEKSNSLQPDWKLSQIFLEGIYWVEITQRSCIQSKIWIYQTKFESDKTN